MLSAALLTACSATTPEPNTIDTTLVACRADEIGSVQAPLDVLSTDQRKAPDVGPMTEQATQAKRLFDNERWVDALPLLERVAAGDTGDDIVNRQVAAYHIGVANYRMQDYRAALTAFELITRDPLHLKRDETLLWLWKLLEQRDLSTDMIDLLPRYDDASFERYHNPAQATAYGWLMFGRGRAWLRRGDTKRAAEVLRRVPRDTPAAPFAERCMHLL